MSVSQLCLLGNRRVQSPELVSLWTFAEEGRETSILVSAFRRWQCMFKDTQGLKGPRFNKHASVRNSTPPCLFLLPFSHSKNLCRFFLITVHYNLSRKTTEPFWGARKEKSSSCIWSAWERAWFNKWMNASSFLNWQGSLSSALMKQHANKCQC